MEPEVGRGHQTKLCEVTDEIRCGLWTTTSTPPAALLGEFSGVFKVS